MIIDKYTNQQVLGALIKNPQLLSQSDKYNLNLQDFSSKFEKILFVAISQLYNQGLKNIQISDIENFLQTDAQAKQIFNTNNGIEYLQDIEDFVDLNNFDYYYQKLKKLNLLRDYEKNGISIKEFYEEDLTKPNAFEINERFEKISTAEITENIKKKLLKIEHKYLKNDSTEVEAANEGMERLIQSFSEKQDIGVPIQGIIVNEILSGARKGTLCIRSAASGTGKTRQAVGDACYLAYPIRYDSKSCSWIHRGSCQKVLFIATEQNFDEIRKMILAYLTDINETKFRYGEFSENEKIILQQAIEIMEEYKDNLHIVRMPNPTIELVKLLIRENCLTKNIKYVFYDYIFIGPSLLNEFRGFNLRNDELLLMFATALKDLAVELNIFVMTSTQVNASADDNKNIRNEASLAGGRSTINKADYGLIMARPTRDELETLKNMSDSYGIPNIVTDVYKVRNGQWTQVRIWSKVDLGTLKKEDLFLTDSKLEPITDFSADFTYEIALEHKQNEKIKQLLERFN